MDANESRLVTTTLAPSHISPLNKPESGVNRSATNRTPGTDRRFIYSENSTPRIQGAPMRSNGRSVPRPTDTPPACKISNPGYKISARNERKFGDGFTHGKPVTSNQSRRLQF